MYERLLDKSVPPTGEDIESYLGDSYDLLAEFESQLGSHCQLSKELKFPFGNSYGWGYKYSRGATHICYAFFEAGAFSVMLQLGGRHVPKVEKLLPELTPETRQLWGERYPCGKEGGGWVHLRVLGVRELGDILALVKIKVPSGKR